MKVQEMLHRLWLLRMNAKGQDLIEYALMAGFVAVAGGAVFPTTLMPSVSSLFSKVTSILGEV